MGFHHPPTTRNFSEGPRPRWRLRLKQTGLSKAKNLIPQPFPTVSTKLNLTLLPRGGIKSNFTFRRVLGSVRCYDLLCMLLYG